MKDAQGHGSDARGAHSSGITEKQPLARWQSAGGKWGAELHTVPGGYRLSETKNGSEVGASFTPGAGQSKFPASELKDDASAIAHYDNRVRGGFDVKMKRII
jgi:hypothetical protein